MTAGDGPKACLPLLFSGPSESLLGKGLEVFLADAADGAYP